MCVLGTVSSSSLEDTFGPELPVIQAAAERNKCTGELFTVLLAIRLAENGPKGTEFGVLHPRARGKGLDTQAGWAAATVVKNYDRWRAAGCPGSYIQFLGDRYCPIQDPRDTRGLNKNWVTNVTRFYLRLRQ